MISQRDNTEDKQSYWQLNHELTTRTLDEDFALGEGIQRGMMSNANTHLNFGRFEGALAQFKRFVDDALAKPGD